MAPVIYLDNNATTSSPDEVVRAMLPFFGDRFGNPSSAYRFGHDLQADIDRARREVAALIAAEPDEIFFTGCGTESDNMALLGALRGRAPKRHVVTSAVEHPAILNLLRVLENEVEVTILPVNSDGLLDPESVADAIRDDTAIVSIMTANNETGVLLPVREVGEVCRKKQIPFHTDAAQAVGKIPLQVNELGVDLLSIAGHKLHAPKGIGALYIRRGTRFMPPFMIGGGQEQGIRSGTENVPYIIGLGKACELAREYLRSGASMVGHLRDGLESLLIERVPGTVVNGHREQRLPNTINISFPGVPASKLVRALGDNGICVSPGAACHAGEDQPSPVLSAMGLSYERAISAIRISLSRYTTKEEVALASREIPRVVESLRELRVVSPG